VPFNVPEASKFAALDERESSELREALLELAAKLDIPVRPVESPALITVGNGIPCTAVGLVLLQREQWLSPEALLLDMIDRHLGTPDPRRPGRELRYAGPIERQLRGLVWKHAIEGYDDLKLRPKELVERLQQKLVAERKP
jgi:hypothetical protein